MSEVKVNPYADASTSRNRSAMGANDDNHQDAGCMHYFLTFLSYLLVICTFPFSLCVCIKIVKEYERAVIYRLGRMTGRAESGLFFILPCIDTIRVVDLRTVTIDIPPQEVLTKDSVTVAVDAVVYYNIKDAAAAVNNIENYQYSTRLLAQTTLRNQLGTRTLAGALSDRENLAHEMQSILDTATDPWGIYVERVELKDVRLPAQMQRAMAAEAEAAREAQAKIIAAKGELDASRALKDAADVISQSQGALQLRYLQTLTQIAAERNSTIIFPLPMDVLPIGKKSKSSADNHNF